MQIENSKLKLYCNGCQLLPAATKISNSNHMELTRLFSKEMNPSQQLTMTWFERRQSMHNVPYPSYFIWQNTTVPNISSTLSRILTQKSKITKSTLNPILLQQYNKKWIHLLLTIPLPAGAVTLYRISIDFPSDSKICQRKQ